MELRHTGSSKSILSVDRSCLIGACEIEAARLMATSRTRAGIAYDRAGPPGEVPVVLLHAGVADRRMWDFQWLALTAERDVLRLDLRGFGESVVRLRGALFPVGDVLDTLAVLGIGRCHLVGAPLGAGVAVEVALTQSELVDSLLEPAWWLSHR